MSRTNLSQTTPDIGLESHVGGVSASDTATAIPAEYRRLRRRRVNPYDIHNLRARHEKRYSDRVGPLVRVGSDRRAPVRRGLAAVMGHRTLDIPACPGYIAWLGCDRGHTLRSVSIASTGTVAALLPAVGRPDANASRRLARVEQPSKRFSQVYGRLQPHQ